MHGGVIAMAKIAALAVLLTLATSPAALADPNLLVWRIAHERMLAKWRRAEPRCGWTVGGYTCVPIGRLIAARAPMK
jgi:hypothetical protein